MLTGDIVVSVETSNSCGEKVLQGTAEVAQLPPLMFLLAGTWHGPAAVHAVWESTDAIYSQFMASLSSRSSRTTQKRRRFLSEEELKVKRFDNFTCNTTDKDRHVKALPLFADIGACTLKYTFSHPNGLLFATQFTQIVLVVTEGYF